MLGKTTDSDSAARSYRVSTQESNPPTDSQALGKRWGKPTPDGAEKLLRLFKAERSAKGQSRQLSGNVTFRPPLLG
jgi:hypothetical protein